MSQRFWASPADFLGYGSGDTMIASWVVGYCRSGEQTNARCLAG